MFSSVHVLVLNSRRPLLRLVSVSRKNGASSLAYCGCVGMGWARMETVTLGPGASVGCVRPGPAARARNRSARTPTEIRRMSASFAVRGRAGEMVGGSLRSGVHVVNGPDREAYA